MTPTEICGVVHHPFFADWKKTEAAALCADAKIMTFSQGEIIYDIGNEEFGLFLIIDGEVVLYSKVDETFFEMDRRKDGDVFGEVSFLTNEPHRVRVMASKACRIGFIPARSASRFFGKPSAQLAMLQHTLVAHISRTSVANAQRLIQQEKMARVGSMVNNIVHDFKSPFQMITLGVETIGKLSQDRQIQRLCSSITEQVTRMLQMSLELGEFSRGKTAFAFQRVGLRSYMAEVLDNNAIYLEKKHVEMSCDVPDIEVDIEPRSMNRVFQNLTSNAVDSMTTKGGRIEIKAELLSRNNLKIIFTDNGRGIPEAIIETIWEPFVTSGKRNGIGLGMAIIKSIVEGHGGTICFHTETDKGTTFTIRLPQFHVTEGNSPAIS